MHIESGHVLFVHAHPDDETITTGGTIATLIDSGVGVTVLTCTRGELGEVIPPELAQLQGDGARLADHREGELAEAIHILGVTDHRYLGDRDARLADLAPRRYLDSGMVWGATGPEPVADQDAESLCAAPLAEVAADIAAVIASVRPDAVVSYDANGGYGHPDHVRAHEATMRAAEIMAVSFFAIDSDAVPGPGALTVDISGALDRKVRALQAHRTQVTVDGDHYALSSGPGLPVLAQESYRLLVRRRAHDTDFRSQPASARSLASALALVLGAGCGILGTVSHQSTLTVAGAELPVGMLAAVAVTTTLLVGLRLVFASRVPAAFAAVGLMLALVVFAQAGPGGSVLIPANTAGYAWTYGLPLIAAVVLAWPRLPVRAAD